MLKRNGGTNYVISWKLKTSLPQIYKIIGIPAEMLRERYVYQEKYLKKISNITFLTQQSAISKYTHDQNHVGIKMQ